MTLRNTWFNYCMDFSSGKALKRIKLCNIYYEQCGDDFVDDMMNMWNETVEYPEQKMDELSLETPAPDEDPGDMTLLTESILTMEDRFKRVNLTITDPEFNMDEKKFPKFKF